MNTNQTFTTGPWRIAVSETDRPPMMSEIEIVATGTVTESARPIARLSLQGMETKANARLIAQSPDLLDLAENLLTVLKYPRGSEAQIRCLEEVAQDAYAIIAKVKGEQN